MVTRSNPETIKNNLDEVLSQCNYLVDCLEKRDSMKFEEFLSMKSPITTSLIDVQSQINYMTVEDREYSKHFYTLKKLLLKIIVDFNEMEKKQLGTYWGVPKLENWEREYKKGPFRKNIINFYKNIALNVTILKKKIK